jgi:APA family basic amino acid/polyamine antiporter
MKRSLRLFDVLCLGLNAIVGSGIFLLPDDLFREMGALSPLAFMFAGLGLVPVAWWYSVAARNHDQTGGPYLYTREAFGSAPAFVVGFMAFATGVLSFAAVSAAAAASLVRLFPGAASPGLLMGAATAGIVFFSGLNYLGARPGAFTVNSFTVVKFAILALVLLVLGGAAGPEESVLASPPPLGGTSAAVFMAVFAVQGFEVVGVPAGESQKPERDVPIGVLGSLLAATVLYMLVQFVLVRGYGGLSAVTDTPLADAVAAQSPRWGFWVALGGVISTWGFVAGTALGTPRYLYALSRGGHLPAGLAALHPRYHSPSRAILLTAGLALLFVSAFDYRALIGMSNVTIAVQYLATCLAVAHLQRAPGGEKYRPPGGLLLPGLGVLMSLWILTEASAEEFTWVAVSLGAGGLLSWFLRRTATKTAA